MLLDTNALIWAYLDAPQLGANARGRIQAADQAFYSSVSVSEITIKHMLGKIELPGGDRFPAVFKEMGLAELQLSSEHASEMLNYPELCRHDPFDRFLIAQAATERLGFLTADRVLLRMGKDWILDAQL